MQGQRWVASAPKIQHRRAPPLPAKGPFLTHTPPGACPDASHAANGEAPEDPVPDETSERATENRRVRAAMAPPGRPANRRTSLPATAPATRESASTGAEWAISACTFSVFCASGRFYN